MIIFQLGIIFMFLAIGELIVWITDIPVPSSIIGMLALTIALQMKWIKVYQVDRVSDFLVKNLGFFFVPAGVSVMLYFDILREQWLPILIATVVSTIIVFDVTGHFHQLSRRFTRHHRRNQSHSDHTSTQS